MHKIIISSLLLASIAAPVMAKDVFTGPYIGVEAGYEAEQDKMRLTSAALGVDATDKDNLGAFNGGAFAGYGQRFGNLYLGGEGHLDWISTDRTKIDGTTTTTQKHNYDVGANLRAGFFPANNVLVYGTLGAAYGKFEFSANDPTLAFTASSDEWLAGVRGGLGVEAQIANNATTRLDWTYTQYQDASSDMTVGGVPFGTVKVTPTTNVVRLGVALAL